MTGGAEKKEVDLDLVVLRRNPILTALGWMMLGAGPLLLGSAALHNPFAMFGIHLAIFGLAIVAAVRRNNWRAKKESGHIHVDAEGVKVGGELIVKRSEIADGFFQPRYSGKYGSSVRLVSKRRQILFEAECDETRALEILHALGLDPGSRRAQFSGSSPIYATLPRQMAWTFGVVFGGMALSGLLASITGGFGGMTMLLLLPILIAGMWPSKITVGIDGILVRWLWTKKFIPMSEVRTIGRDGERAISIHTAGGKIETITTGMRRRSRSAMQGEHRDAVLARINEALWLFRSRGPVADVSALVGRGDRTRSEWMTALKKLAGAEGGYRDAVVREEDLFRVVEDPAAPEDARAGAMLVLKKSLDDEGKARVRIAAEATASPKLRVVLDSATNADDAALEEALADLAPNDPPAAAAVK